MSLRQLGVFGAGVTSTTKGSGPGPGGPGVFAVAEGMDIAAEGRLYPFMESLWRRIDAGLGYPPELVQRRVSGYVEAQLVVDHRGVLTGEVLDLRGDHAILNTYALGAVYAALRTGLPRGAWRAEEGTVPILVRIRFELFGEGAPPPRPEGPAHFKNLLSFGRASQSPNVVRQAFDELFTEYVPPILPIPGGIYVDVYRLYQFVKNIGRPKSSEKRETRYQLRREEWDAAIRAGGR